MEDITIENDGYVCKIQFNTQCYLNQKILTFLCKQLEIAERNISIKVILFIGEKHVFSKGQDVREICVAYENKISSYSSTLKNTYHRMLKIIRNSSKTYISIVNGIAVGAAMSIALSCDIIIASNKAVFYMPYIELGLIPDGGILYILLTTIGYHKTYELICTKRYYTANELYELGIINSIGNEQEILDQTKQLVAKFDDNFNINSLIKSYLNINMSKIGLERALYYECKYQDLARNTIEHAKAMRKLKLQ